MSSGLLVEDLRAYCRAKPGVKEDWRPYAQNYPIYQLLDGFLGCFAQFYLEETPPCLVLRYEIGRLTQLQSDYPLIQTSNKINWESKGWIYVDIPLHISIPKTVLYRLIDESYDFTYTNMSEIARELVVLSTQNPSEQDYLRKLIELHNLSHHRTEIESVIKPAILLKAHATTETDMALGQSKIGGLPDLPPEWEWPFKDGMPLAFLAQINLSEVPFNCHKGVLPSHGILYFFTIFAWQLEDGDLPHDIPWERCLTEPGWSEVLFFTGDTSVLRRMSKPSQVHMRVFPVARVTFEAVPSLPRGGDFARDPVFEGTNWPDDEFERYDDLYFNFHDVLEWVRNYSAKHQLLGYTNPIQNAVTRSGTRLLFQFDTDRELDIWVGGGGTIYFAIEENDLAQRDFSRIIADLQSD